MCCAGCSSSEEQAQDLLSLARLEVRAAQGLDASQGTSSSAASLSTTSPPLLATVSGTSDRRTLQLAHLRKALELTSLISQKFPDTLLGQGISTGTVDLGGLTVRDLKETALPRLELRVKAEADPLLAAQVIILSIPERSTQAGLQIALARSFDVAGRVSESQVMLRDALLTASAITNPAERILHLSDIAIAHANASRKNESLEVAFLALSSAKQVTDPEQRANALTQIALVYYTLGVEQRGYEALQSIQNRERRAAALKEVAEKLLEKNLPHQALAASTILFNSEARIRFLTSLARSAQGKDSSASILLFLDQSIPLIPKLASARARSEALLLHASLLRSAGQTERSTELLSRATELVQEDDLPTAQLLSSAALEFAELGKAAECTLLSQRALSLLKKIPSTEDSDSERIRAIVTIATALATSDEPTKALDALKLISQEGRRAVAFAQLARLSDEKGSSGFAKRFLQEAQTILSRLTEQKERSALLLELRESYLQLNRVDDAKRTALALRQEDTKWKSYLRGFQAQLFQKGLIDDGIAIARSTEDPYVRAVLLTEAAKFQFKGGAVNEVVSLLEEAAESAEYGKNSARSLALAALIADTMLQAKLPRLALNLVEKNDFSDLPVWYCRVAEAFIGTGQKQDAVDALYNALKAAQKLSLWGDKVKVLLKVGEVYSNLDLGVGIEGVALITQILSTLPEARDNK